MIPGAASVIAELWALLVVVLVAFIMRIASRRILLGAFKKFKSDDYIMLFAVALFTVCIFSIWQQCLLGNNYVTADDVVDWTPEVFAEAIVGAKWGVVMETCKITCVWLCKAALLVLYFQMTKGLPQYHRAVKFVAAYVAVGYVIVMTCFFFAWCWPFHYYYDVIPLPDDKSECMTYRHHMILDACFNITSDAVMLCLPIPLVIKAKVPPMRKVALVGVFSLGGLVILCAILNRITNFTAPYGSLVYLNWYAGEAATAVLVANVPHLWPLIASVFRLGAWRPGSGNNSSGNKGSSGQYPSRSGGVGASHHRSAVNMSSGRKNKYDIDVYDPSSSEEHIATNGQKDGQWGYSKKSSNAGIDVSETIGRADDLEMGRGKMTTSIQGGKSGMTAGNDEHAVDVAVEEVELGAWPMEEDRKSDAPLSSSPTGPHGHIVKTVHINQYAT